MRTGQKMWFFIRSQSLKVSGCLLLRLYNACWWTYLKKHVIFFFQLIFVILCSNLFSIESKTLSHINGHNDRRYQNVYKNKQYLFKVKRSADWPLKTLYNSLTKDLSTENESVGGQSFPYNSQRHRWEIHWY